MKALITTLRYAEGMLPYYIGVAVCSLLVALTGIAAPFVISRATTLMVEVVEGGAVGMDQVMLLAGLLFVFDVLNALLRNLGGYWGDLMAARLKAQLSVHYFHHLLRLPQGYYDDELTGTIINRLHRVITEMINLLNTFANSFLQMFLTTLITIGVVLYYSVELGLLVIAIYPLFFWLAARTSRKWRSMQNRKNHETDRIHGRFSEIMAQIKVVKSFVRESLEYRNVAKRYRKTIATTRKQSRYWRGMDAGRGVLLAVVFLLIFGYIFKMTAEQRFTIGEMVLLITLINGLRVPLFSMSFVIDNFQKVLAGGRNFVKAMQLKPAIQDAPNAVELRDVAGEISFQDVSFHYEVAKDNQVLRDVSFTIQPGQRVALVSESGGGKTTITSLLMRLYEPQSGQITIDGTPITAVTQASLRRSIATVFQDSVLLSGTIRENIAYGKPGATDKEIFAAAKAANADEFIRQLDYGYDTQIGEYGLRLSGGQKQRIAIARAILKDAPILILDEVTSNLDNKSARLVQQAFRRLMKGRTTIIIAHRLSTIASVDTIITLKKGRVDEVGTPDALANSGGMYAKLLALRGKADAASDEKLAAYDIAAERLD
ncbi:MAG: ABC transporter ATP-binding protein [Candidatus Saccharibacteria bacterium]|nr:ABC transporter ATP-binding protein [Candidatus Saccharibacteria bacterium]